ncbi:MAG: hypothetical protein ABIJ92_04735 [Candidatus Aenigmatarchaeota archaeon]
MDAVLFQAGGSAFPVILQNLQNMGFFLYLFPFLLALAIIYGVLSFSLSAQLPNSARGLISIIFAFFVMLYSSFNVGIVTFFANLTGIGLIVGSGILFVAILLGLIGFDIKKLTEGDGHSKWIWILAIIVIAILIFFAAGADQFGLVPSWATSSEFMTLVFFVVIIALAMFWLGSGGGGKSSGGDKKD